MEFQGFNSKDFDILSKLKIFNKENYKKFTIDKNRNKIRSQYKTPKHQEEAKRMNRIVFIKMIALKDYIKSDLRFRNFEIGMCSPKAQAGRGKLGDYRSVLWIWMVEKKLLKMGSGKNGDEKQSKLCLPQIQVCITENKFKTSEIWFEKNSFNYLNKFVDHFKGKFNGDSKVNLFCWKEYDESSRFNKPASKDVMLTFSNKIESGKINEASIYLYKNKNEVINDMDLVEQVKNDLLYLIKNYYEPAYGKVLFQSVKKNLGKHKVDIEKKKKVETIGYDMVTEHYEKIGYEVKPVFKDNVGWDLEAIFKSEKLLLEVKGLSGKNINIELTPNEYSNLKKEKQNYRVCVVTDALVKPNLYIYSCKNGDWIDKNGRKLKTDERIGLKMFWE